MFKKFIMVMAVCLIASTARAEITLKQGALYLWDDGTVKNLTTINIAKTKAIESWGKWNLLWDGWLLDVGYAYNGTENNTGALLLGREFGTLGKYLPIDYPLADKINISVYPIGIYANDLFAHPNFKPCSGGALLKLSVNF